MALNGGSWGGAFARPTFLRAHLVSRQRPFFFAAEVASVTNSLHAVVVSLRICALSWLRRRFCRASSSWRPVAVYRLLACLCSLRSAMQSGDHVLRASGLGRLRGQHVSNASFIIFSAGPAQLRRSPRRFRALAWPPGAVLLLWPGIARCQGS